MTIPEGIAGSGNRGWIIAVAAMLSAILPAMEFVQGYWQKEREMAIAQAKHTHETQRVWIGMAVNQELPERAKERVLRFLEKSVQDPGLQAWASEELKLVKKSIKAAEDERDTAKAEAMEARKQQEELRLKMGSLETMLAKARSSTEAGSVALATKVAETEAQLQAAREELAASRARAQNAIQTATGIENRLSKPSSQAVANLARGARPARVFVHIRTDAQRPLADTIASILSANGVAVPRIELVQIGPRNSELRFYREAERLEVEELVQAAQDQGLSITPRYMRGRENDRSIKPRTYELWLAP